MTHDSQVSQLNSAPCPSAPVRYLKGTSDQPIKGTTYVSIRQTKKQTKSMVLSFSNIFWFLEWCHPLAMNSEIILGIFSLLLPTAELSPNLMDLPTPQLSICPPTSGLSHAAPLPRNLFPPSSSGYLDLRSRDHLLREAVLTSLLRSSLPLLLGLQRPCYCCSFTSVGTVMWWPCLH